MYKLNHNKQVVKIVQKGLKRNYGYCPCRIERSEHTKCLCTEFKTTGYCCCGLFIREEDK